MIAVQAMGTGMTQPFLMIYLHEVRHISLSTAGFLLMMTGIAGLLATIPCGRLIERFGAWAVLLSGTTAMCAATVTLGFAATPIAAAGGLILAGLNTGLSQPSRNVLISTVTSGAQRRAMYALNFALLSLTWGLGGVISGLYLNVHKTSTFVTIFLADASLMMSAAAILLGPLRNLRRPASGGHKRSSTGSVLKVLLSPGMIRICVLTLLVSFIGYGQLESGIPVFAREVSQISTRTVGIAFGVNTLVIGALQLWVVRKIEGVRRTRVIVIFGVTWAGAWGILAATGAVPATTWADLGFVLFMVAFAFGEMLMMPLLPVITNDLAVDRVRGHYNALQAGANQTGGIVGPAVAGVVLQHELNALYIALMAGGCLAVLATALSWEKSIDPEVNGLSPASSTPTAPTPDRMPGL